MRTDKPRGDVEVWLARQAVANATMDMPDVDGFMERFGEALLRAVREISVGTVLNRFTNMYGAETLNLAKSYSGWIRKTLGPTNITYSAQYALIYVFTEWMAGGSKSHLARDFVINTCRAAMAAGV